MLTPGAEDDENYDKVELMLVNLWLMQNGFLSEAAMLLISAK